MPCPTGRGPTASKLFGVVLPGRQRRRAPARRLVDGGTVRPHGDSEFWDSTSLSRLLVIRTPPRYCELAGPPWPLQVPTTDGQIGLSMTRLGLIVQLPCSVVPRGGPARRVSLLGSYLHEHSNSPAH